VKHNTNVSLHPDSQRAFRERKERHVRDLEDKVNNLEQASDTLHADNERLKRELAKYTTENEILRATSQHPNRAFGKMNEPPEPTVTGPMRYSPTDFYSSLVPDGPATPRSPQHRVTVCPVTGEKLLDAGATWDLIQGHELFKRGQVDIGDVTERLKGMAQCDGQGPAFKEGQVRQAIEESVAMGRDELI
jgi:AP-1-like factor